jgi:hypothetical protein
MYTLEINMNKQKEAESSCKTFGRLSFKRKTRSESLNVVYNQEVQFMQRKLDLMYTSVVGGGNLYKQILRQKGQCLIIIITTEDN